MKLNNKNYKKVFEKIDKLTPDMRREILDRWAKKWEEAEALAPDPAFGYVKFCAATPLFETLKGFPKDARKEILLKFDTVLENLFDQDFFGTEGQMDPRGDHRNQS